MEGKGVRVGMGRLAKCELMKNTQRWITAFSSLSLYPAYHSIENKPEVERANRNDLFCCWLFGTLVLLISIKTIYICWDSLKLVVRQWRKVSDIFSGNAFWGERTSKDFHTCLYCDYCIMLYFNSIRPGRGWEENAQQQHFGFSKSHSNNK